MKKNIKILLYLILGAAAMIRAAASDSEPVEFLELPSLFPDADFPFYLPNSISSVSETVAQTEVSTSSSEEPSLLSLRKKRERPGDSFTCLICGKCFKDNNHMQEHIKSMHLEVRHQCDLCEKNYTDRSSLRRHIKNVHKGVRYPCGLCDQSFTQTCHLAEHIKSMHERKIYACAVCKKGFGRKSNLKRHVEKKHDAHLQKRKRGN